MDIIAVTRIRIKINTAEETLHRMLRIYSFPPTRRQGSGPDPAPIKGHSTDSPMSDIPQRLVTECKEISFTQCPQVASSVRHSTNALVKRRLAQYPDLGRALKPSSRVDHATRYGETRTSRAYGQATPQRRWSDRR